MKLLSYLIVALFALILISDKKKKRTHNSIKEVEIFSFTLWNLSLTYLCLALLFAYPSDVTCHCFCVATLFSGFPVGRVVEFSQWFTLFKVFDDANIFLASCFLFLKDIFLTFWVIIFLGKDVTLRISWRIPNAGQGSSVLGHPISITKEPSPCFTCQAKWTVRIGPQLWWRRFQWKRESGCEYQWRALSPFIGRARRLIQDRRQWQCFCRKGNYSSWWLAARMRSLRFPGTLQWNLELKPLDISLLWPIDIMIALSRNKISSCVACVGFHLV